MARLSITGTGEIKAALRRLAKDAEAAAEAAVRKGLEPVLEETKALAPVDTGELRDAARIEELPARGASAAAEVLVESDHAAAEEFGTATRPGTRFLTRAFDGRRDEAASRALETFRRELGV